jgi:hypothetical protein
MNSKNESFSRMFQRWSFGEEAQNSQLTRRLKEECRSAWEGGDLEDCLCVLDFIRLSQDPDSFDILTKGMEHEEEEIATHAVSTASSLMMRGVSLGPSTRELLERFESRFPSRASAAKAGLAFLNKLEGDQA